MRVTWAAGLFDPRALAQRAWVSGVVATPLSAELRAARCLALTARDRGGDAVLAVSTLEPAPRPLADAVVAQHLAALAADPRELLRAERSPVAPWRVRTLCTSLGLTEHGACHAWLRDGAVAAEVRRAQAAVGVARALERLAVTEREGGRARTEALVGAALWLVATRDAAGRAPATSLDAAWREASEAVGEALRAESAAPADPLGDEGMRLLELAIQVDPTDNRARLDMEDRRPRAASRVRGVEAALQALLLGRLRDAERGAAKAGAAAGGDPGRDVAALLGSLAREGRLLVAWRCLDAGACAAWADHPAVRPWAAWFEHMLGLGPAAPEPATRRVVWGFEAGSLHGFRLLGEAWGPGPEEKPLPGQHQPSGHEQRALLDSFHGGDDTTGVAEGAPFAVEDDFVGMLLGGGTEGAGLRVELVVGDEVVLSAASPQRSPTLDPVVWDLRPWRGQVATLRLVDEARGAWGHLLVDAITWLR